MAGSTSAGQGIKCAKGLVEFLQSDAGLTALAKTESRYDVILSIEGNVVNVEPLTNLSDIQENIVASYHHYEFKKALRLRLLNEASSHFWQGTLPVAKAAIVAFNRPSIVRSSGILELLVETNGEVAMFGDVKTISSAREEVDSICSTELRDVTSEPNDGELPLTPISATISATSSDCIIEHGSCPLETSTDTRDICSSTSVAESVVLSPPTDSTPSPSAKRRERLLFTVRSVDAPRLIGTRGMNKRRIEEATNCLITLHTEAKKDGEFPVEVCGYYQRECELARSFIQSFLNEPPRLESDKKFKERPKIHLEISPRKTRSSDSSVHVALKR